MDKPRNKDRAPGMTVLGVPMHQSLKARIKAASEIDRRTMADWSRIQLEQAAEAVIGSHTQGNPANLLAHKSITTAQRRKS
jgi:hypothetical protein